MSSPSHQVLARALAHYEAGRFEAALADLQSIPGIETLAIGCSLMGGICVELKRPAEALRHLDRALKLGAARAELWLQRGSAHAALGQFEDAVADLDQALALEPGNAGLWSTRGWHLVRLGRPDAAVVSIDRALALRPDFPDALVNRAMVRLLTGDYAGGLEDYEARYRAEQSRVAMPDTFDCPVWQGEDLKGKTLLAHSEQGMGDAIQFVRFVPDLVARGARVVIGAPARLCRLFRPFETVAEIRDTSLPGEDFDFTVPLMSLPHRLGYRNVGPSPAPYLAAEPDLVAHWRARIGDHGRRIGIVWQGNPSGAIDRGRSVALAAFAPLARLPGVRLIALQKGHGLEQIATLPSPMRVETLGDDFDAGPDAFIDTAAAMMAMDLIVTTDTSVAHLAGALGRPTLLLLQKVPDWRWGLTGETTPWYGSVHLVRQARRGDWNETLRRAAKIAGAMLAHGP